MQLYETSAAWKELTREDPSRYELPQSSRALMCMVKSPCVDGYAYIESVHLHLDGNTGKALLQNDCDIIECVYNLSGYKAWYEVGGVRFPIEKRIALIAIHCAQVVLCVEGRPSADITDVSLPQLTVKKCMLQCDLRRKVACGASFAY